MGPSIQANTLELSCIGILLYRKNSLEFSCVGVLLYRQIVWDLVVHRSFCKSKQFGIHLYMGPSIYANSL